MGPSVDSARILVKRLGAEDDRENLTWCMAALVCLGNDHKTVHSICRDAGVDYDQAFTLAAQLFASNAWIDAVRPDVKIDIYKDDDITLKWASLLDGYGKAQAELFHPRLPNIEVLKNLNVHDSNQVSEYSIWAIYNNPKYSASDLSIDTDQFQQQPANVRRWINRVLSKQPSFFRSHVDLFSELTQDGDVRAREGLALGITNCYVAELSNYTLGWLDVEGDETVRDLLLEHMAINADQNPVYADQVVQAFRRADDKSPLRRRLLSAASGTGTYSSLRRIMISEEKSIIESAPGGGLFDTAESNLTIVNHGKINMSQNTFSAGRDIRARAIAGSDMYQSANDSVQSLGAEDHAIKAVLEEILTLVRDESVLEEDRESISSAVTIVAEQKSASSAQKLVDNLRRIGSSTKNVIAGAGRLVELADTVMKWFP